MKLKPQQLSSHIKSGLRHAYLISGDEPLLVEETLDALRRAAKQQGFGERERHVAERGFDWQGLTGDMGNLSLFASRRLLEVRLPTGKPGDKGSRALAGLAANKNDDTVLLVITPRLDSKAVKTRWAKALASDGVWIDHPVMSHEDLPRWIAARLTRQKLRAEPDALELLAARVEGNLLAAKQEIDKLELLAGETTIDVEVMRNAVSDGARYDVFQLAEAALAGDAPRAAKILNGLEREGVAAPLVFWSLAREANALAALAFSGGTSADTIFRTFMAWGPRQPLLRRAARRFGPAVARQLLELACRTELIVKGRAHGQPWVALLDLTLALAGPGRARAA